MSTLGWAVPAKGTVKTHKRPCCALQLGSSFDCQVRSWSMSYACRRG